MKAKVLTFTMEVYRTAARTDFVVKGDIAIKKRKVIWPTGQTQHKQTLSHVQHAGRNCEPFEKETQKYKAHVDRNMVLLNKCIFH